MARILVIDDEIGIRGLLEEILQDHLHEVKTAANAEEAKALMHFFAPQVIFLDIWLKQSNGLDLLKEWHEERKVTMPIIMMSGHANVETWATAAKFGAYCLLEKPISIKVLLSTLKPAVEIALKQKPAPLSRSAVAPSYIAPPPPLMATPPEPVAPPPPHPIYDQDYRLAREAFERAYFTHHICVRHGSMTAISEVTGVERTHLYRVLKSLGLNDLKTQHRMEKSGNDRPNLPQAMPDALQEGQDQNEQKAS